MQCIYWRHFHLGKQKWFCSCSSAVAELYESVNWQENHQSLTPLFLVAAHLNLIWTEFHIKNEPAFPARLCSPMWNLSPRNHSKCDGLFSLFVRRLFMKRPSQVKRGWVRDSPAQPRLRGDGNSSSSVCLGVGNESAALFVDDLAACGLSLPLLMWKPVQLRP